VFAAEISADSELDPTRLLVNAARMIDGQVVLSERLAAKILSGEEQAA
jgi:hypothetical protein